MHWGLNTINSAMIVLTNLSLPSHPANLFLRISLINDFYGCSLWQGTLGIQADVHPYSFSWDIFLILHVASVSKHLHMIRLFSLNFFETVLVFMMGKVFSSLSLTVMNFCRWTHRPFCLMLDNCTGWTSKIILMSAAKCWFLMNGLTCRWRERLPESESCITFHHWACVLVHWLII